MLRPKCYITITNSEGVSTTFNFVNRFEINKSFEYLTANASITLPRKLSQEGLPLFAGTNPVFKRKDKIKIEAGYFPNRETLFEGFISYVSANIPVHLECEDYMFLMKQYKVTYPKTVVTRTLSKKGKPLKYKKIVSENITLQQLMDYIFEEGEYNDLLDGITYEIFGDDPKVKNFPLGQFRASNATPAQIFDKLRDDYGLFTYFVDKVLYVGFANNAFSTKEAEFKMEEVCINSNDLDYQMAEDVSIRVKCVGMMPDNTKVEAEAGDTDGEQRTYHFYNVSDVTELKRMAEERVKNHKYTGFKGWFETFGEPHLEHGDRAKITSTKLPERNGTYLIKSNKIVFGVEDGYRQYFDLGYKLI